MNQQDMIRKISAILKKAEGTDNEHEAATFFAAANDLMLKYSIEEAQVRAEARQRDGARVESPVQEYWMWATHDAHAKAKERLIEVIALSQHVRFSNFPNKPGDNMRREGNSGRYSQWGSLVGFKQDIENVKLLYTSMLIQWARFARHDVRETGRKDYGFKTGHLMGFADRVNERLDAQSREVVAAANANALMVNKDAEIDAWLVAKRGPVTNWYDKYCLDFSYSKRKFCSLIKGHVEAGVIKHAHTIAAARTSSTREVDGSGYRSGQAAGSRADVGRPSTKIGG